MRLSDSVRMFLLGHLSNFSRLSSSLAFLANSPATSCRLPAACCPLASVHPETMFLDVILRSKATKNLIVSAAAEILRGVYPEPAEGLRMTLARFRLNTS